MSKKTRTILFFLFTFLCVATIPFLTAYTQGYRLDWEHRRFVQTGGMDFSVRPLGVRVFVDDKFRQETNFFFRDLVVRNILPRDYTVRIEREGYYAWHKTVSVYESIVTKFPEIRLFPQNPQRTEQETALSQLYASPDGRYALALSEEGGLPAVQLLSFEGELSSTTILSLRTNEQLIRADFNAESSVVWFITTLQGVPALYTVNVQEPTEVVAWEDLIAELGAANLVGAQIAPTASSTSIFVAPLDATTQTYTVYSLIAGQSEPIETAENIRAVGSVDSSLILLDEQGILLERDMPSGEVTVLSTDALGAANAENPRLIIENNARAIAILADETLWLWQQGHQFDSFAEGVNGASFAPNALSLAFWNESELSVLWLETLFGPPARQRGEEHVLISTENIQEGVWLEDRSAHIAAITPTHVVIAELDGRDHRNIVSYNIENVFAFFTPLTQHFHALPGGGNIISFSIE